MYQGSYCIVAPIVTATCEEMNISISKTIFSVGLVSIAACAIIPVGGSPAMLAELNGYIAANGYEQYTMEAMDLFKGRGMSLLVLILYTTFVGFRFAPEKPIVASKDSSELSKRVAHHEPLKRPQEISAIASTASSLGNPYLIGALFYLIPFFLTQIMQNRTVMAIFAPIAILACKSMGADCTGPLLLVASACCTAFMTPMATPTVPMVMGIGGYDMKSNMKQSILPAILLSVANILWVMTIYPL